MEEEKSIDLLDDCAAMVECLRCLEDKGVKHVGTDCVTLRNDLFDQMFPGVAWEESTTKDGEPIGIRVKTAEYRGFLFNAFEMYNPPEAL